MEYTVLEKNLMDMVREQQAKLGYRKENVRLYYPLGTLNHFFHSSCTPEEMQELLEAFAKEVRGRLGVIRITHSKERFCFDLPETMSEYVHETMSEDTFIQELVDLISTHGTTIDQIKALFYQHSDQVEIRRIRQGEFDWMMRFEQMEEDRYYYCFKEEGCHITYHRFLPEDYEEFGFDSEEEE